VIDFSKSYVFELERVNDSAPKKVLAMATTVRGLGDIGFRGHEISWVAV
jgi:hypothetical protein